MNKFNEDICIEQTYEVLLGNETIHTLMDSNEGVNLLYDPTIPLKDIDPTVFDILLDYYIDLEEYEKCQKITDFRKIIF
ncbi:MAG TPA: hypothetical protein DCM40_24550 [Maribacter sp.]|mgnify:FL=1|jgi:hypothetical protein|nr:hypothetical protein [Maribacter sp.]|tara:strand:- start:337 stop:573 length:237 start_codon:yes stop_codon:yes gene_type:complete